MYIYIYINCIVGYCWYITWSGWWYTYPSEKHDFVSWDDDISQLFLESHKIPWFQTTNQNYIIIYCYKSLSFYSVILTHTYIYIYIFISDISYLGDMRHFAKAETRWTWDDPATFDVNMRCKLGCYPINMREVNNQYFSWWLKGLLPGSTIWMNSEEFLEQSPNKNGHLPIYIY